MSETVDANASRSSSPGSATPGCATTASAARWRKLLAERELPDGVQVIDFGTGGLDLAYEVMRGYDALILIDVSRQGEAPGTLYVMEASEDDVDGKIEDGQMLDPHGMDPQTVLRFVKYVGGWPGRVFVVACEPDVVEDVGFGLSDAVSGAVGARGRRRARDRRGAQACMSCRSPPRCSNTVERTPPGGR